jgi:hypothetical protein
VQKLKKNTMKKIIKIVAVVTMFLFIQSCVTQQPLQRAQSDNNQSYVVEYLFEHDGCKMYRFFDRGYYVYFSNCSSEITNITSDSTRVRTIPLAR